MRKQPLGCFKITSSPSFVVIALATCHQTQGLRGKVMFLAETFKMAHGIFNPKRRCDNILLRSICIAVLRKANLLACFCRELLSKICSANFGARFCRTGHSSVRVGFPPSGDANFCTGFKGMSLARSRTRLTFFSSTLLGAGFIRGFFAAIGTNLSEMGAPHLFTGLLRKCVSQTSSASNTINIKSCFTKGFKLIEPILLSFNQEYGCNQLDHLKNKCVDPIFVKSQLEFLIVVCFASKFSKVVLMSSVKISSASNVKHASGGTSDAVDARTLRNIRNHALNYLPFSALLLRCQGGKATTFSVGLITPSLDNSSIITREPASRLAL